MKTSTTLAVAIVTFGVAGAAYLLWDEQPASPGGLSRIIDIPGWDKLDPCFYLTSFDGLHALTFSAQRRIDALRNEIAKGQSADQREAGGLVVQ